MFRRSPAGPEVFLVHHGGPFWARKDAGAWSIPKGELHDNEDALIAAAREFEEETGFPVAPPLYPLGELKQPAGKIIAAWAFEGDCVPEQLRSNTFQIEWPKKSGILRDYPEVDRGAWFPLEAAYRKILKGQAPFLDRLRAHLGY